MGPEKADLVLHDGAILGHPESDSVAIGEGRIIAHGRYSDLKLHIGPRTHMVPLAGRAVGPGFIDCHQHFMEGAAVAAGLSLIRSRTIGDLLTDLRVAAAKSPPGNWLRAFGCDEALMRERRGPTRAELDQAVPKNPLRLRHQTLHGSWLNSRAIAAAGLESPDWAPPEGTYVGRDASGALNGFVAGMEEWLSSRMPRVTVAEMESRARFYSRELAAAGITAFTDATVRNGPDEVATFAKLVAGGSICQRVALMVGPQYLSGLNSLRKTAETARIRLAGLKFMDVARWKPDLLMRLVSDALSQGLDCAFHVTEVEELAAVLEACERARERVSQRELERVACRIEHGGMIPPDYPERIAAISGWVVTNPGFIYYRGAKYAGEPGLIPYLYRGRSLLDSGVRLAAGTDAPVTPAKPLTAIAAAVGRVSVEGYELALTEGLAPEAAFALFTTGAARLSRLEAGEIEVGRLADLIVLPADPLKLNAAELVNLAVDMTIVGGHVVYERGRPAVSQTAGLPMLSS
ncbi:MAG TPA: amidohydrolase family protein [Candidatus Binataceae bacterium]|nr:amidohydrolase family protein [Candidatus Binataceae bacterium]